MAGTEFVLDLTGFKDRVGSHVDPGRYRVLVEDAEMDKSKAGNPMVNVWYKVLTPGPFEGVTLIDRLTITEKALFRIVGFMQAIGLPTPKKRLRLNLGLFIGKVLDVDVEDGEPYQGRVKSEIRGYLRAAAAESLNGAENDVMDLVPDDVTGAAVPDDAEVPEDLVVDEAEEVAEPVTQPTPIRREAAAIDEPEVVDLDTLDIG